jgi:DNA-binding transcriptional LysR family regulator
MALHDLNQIAVFLNVVEQKGIRAAAEKLDMAQSSVSRTVTALEARLGVRLFERSTRSFRVTGEGLRYYEQCRAGMNIITMADALIRHRRDELVGKVLVSVPAILGKYLMSEVLTTFLIGHPKAQLVLDVTDRVVDLVPEGVDLAVRFGPLPEQSSLVSRLLAQPAAGLYASATYLHENGAPHTPDDLRLHRTLILGPPEMKSEWTLLRDGERSVQALTPSLQTNDIPSLLNAAAAGCGICMAPHFVCRQERLTEALVQVLPDWQNEPVDLRVFYPSHQSVTPLLRVLIDLLVERAPIVLNIAAYTPLKGAAAANTRKAVVADRDQINEARIP